MDALLINVYIYTHKWSSIIIDNTYRRLRTCGYYKYMRTAKILALTTLITAHAVIVTPTLRFALQWDIDSGILLIDNISKCTSYLLSDFWGSLQDCHMAIKGFGGTRHFQVEQKPYSSTGIIMIMRSKI